MRLYMPRFYVLDPESNLRQMKRDAALAAAEGCDCVVFPEQFITAYYAECEPQRIRDEFADTSSTHPEMLFCMGTVSEDGVNRLCMYRGGIELVHYDKIHLFLPNGEGEIWGVGDKYVAFSHGDWRIGLATCNDVRFPEQVRDLKLKFDINLMLYPALWPWQRYHVWSSLLKARAIENGIFVIGCCVAGVDNGTQLFDGAGNHVFSPVGDEIHPQGRVYDIDPSLLEAVTVDTKDQFCQIDKVELTET